MAQKVIEKLSQGNILFVGDPSNDLNSALSGKGLFSELKKQIDRYNVKKTNTNDWSEISAFITVHKVFGGN